MKHWALVKKLRDKLYCRENNGLRHLQKRPGFLSKTKILVIRLLI